MATKRMRVIHRDSWGCSGGNCPTIYESDDGQIYVQGYLSTEGEREGVELAPNEGLVRISRRLLESLSQG
jgi:hypothetical protein